MDYMHSSKKCFLEVKALMSSISVCGSVQYGHFRDEIPLYVYV